MALCKNCFHREVCEHLATWTTINLDDIPPEIPCSHFKDTADVAPRAEWISVEERLPDNCRAVLVALEGLTIGGAPAMVIGSYSGGYWMVADADGTHYLTKYMRYKVTHWMPLPEPPKTD